MKLNCDTFIIDGKLYEYTYRKGNVHIGNSYEISKADFGGALASIEVKHPDLDIWKRSTKSLKREWATHNLCYSIGLAKNHTKDVDLNYPQNWGGLYNIVGAIAMILIK